MARGWESKSVEDQVSERDAISLRREGETGRLTDAERAEHNKLRSLQLSRSRVANQLSAAKNPAHRTMLERALAALDEQIAAVSDEA